MPEWFSRPNALQIRKEIVNSLTLRVHFVTTSTPLVISVQFGLKMEQIRDRGYEMMGVEKDTNKIRTHLEISNI